MCGTANGASSHNGAVFLLLKSVLTIDFVSDFEELWVEDVRF
jgi:hypothetical protein